MPVEDRLRALRGERHLARRELVEHDAARVDVATRVELVAAALFGRHVLGRAGDDPGFVRGARERAVLRNAEVAYLHELERLAVVVEPGNDDQVLRFDVAMDDPARVRVREPGTGLHHDLGDALRGEGAVLGEDRAQLDAGEELHREIEEPVRLLTEVDDARDVRVVESARGERLGVEATTEVDVVLERLVEDLHGDGHAQLAMARPVDRAHAAAADERLHQQFPAGERAPEDGIDRLLRKRGGPREVRGVARRQGHAGRRAPAAHHAVQPGRRLAPCARRPRVGHRLDAHRKAVLGGRAQRQSEIEEGLRHRGQVHLEDVLRCVDRGRVERDVHLTAREGSGVENLLGLVVGEIGDEYRQEVFRGQGSHRRLLRGSHLRPRGSTEASAIAPQANPSPGRSRLQIRGASLHICRVDRSLGRRQSGCPRPSFDKSATASRSHGPRGRRGMSWRSAGAGHPNDRTTYTSRPCRSSAPHRPFRSRRSCCCPC
jgi:hypothetical protein